MSLLEVTDLRVSFPTADGVVQAVRGVSFSIERGRTLGIVGESGSGKTVLTQSLLGLTPGGQISGKAMFEGANLVGLEPRAMQRVRGKEIAVIFQDPLTSLHPLYKVGWQIVEMIRAHDKSVTKAQAAERSVELLAHVGIPRPKERVQDYPHQFSGGMRQRVMIAMAISLNPKLIIADEPTTALDATVQAQILDLLLRLQQESDTALLMITHDLGVVADIADNVMVMYAGRAAEKSSKRDIFYQPHHPYTKGLLESIPHSSAGRERLIPITGQPPSLIRLPSGCAFHPRCGYVMDRCLTDEPRLTAVGGAGGHTSGPAPGYSDNWPAPAADVGDQWLNVAEDAAEPDVALAAAAPERPRPATAAAAAADFGEHLSACWLPSAAAGLSDQVEELRRRTVEMGRSGQAAKVAEAIAAAPESKGSVIA
jgi:oligopeptide/dipeptide ABC transporter ATP-binding protein